MHHVLADLQPLTARSSFSILVFIGGQRHDLLRGHPIRARGGTSIVMLYKQVFTDKKKKNLDQTRSSMTWFNSPYLFIVFFFLFLFAFSVVCQWQQCLTHMSTRAEQAELNTESIKFCLQQHGQQQINKISRFLRRIKGNPTVADEEPNVMERSLGLLLDLRAFLQPNGHSQPSSL